VIRAIFVDDEPNVLSGLRRMLRSMDPEWELRFCTSGAEALAEMTRQPCDIIVADMRMPGMDGATLLEEVSRNHPGVIRIVLSGQAGQESILRAVGPAHQYLSKPCDADTMKAKLRQAVRLRSVLANPSLERLVAQLHGLPSVPTVYLDLVAAMQSDNASLRTIGAIVERDAAMTAKILQLVNSAYFGLWGRITSASQAVQLLGVDLVRTLILSTHVFSSLDNAAMRRFQLHTVWNHSLQVSRFARTIAALEEVGPTVMTESLTSGMLHDIGRVVLASCIPDRYTEVVASATAEHPLAVIEQEALGCTHAEVGAYLLGLWGLPDPITVAVAFHHRPSQAGEHQVGALALVHAADSIAKQLSADAHAGAGPLDAQFLNDLGLSDRYDAWVEACRDIDGVEASSTSSSQGTHTADVRQPVHHR
jgi:HD-like signal output (HDOD) protein